MGGMNWVVFNHLQLNWNSSVPPLDPRTWVKYLHGTAKTAHSELKLTLVPNTVIWRLDCDPEKRSDTNIALHCRNVLKDSKETFVTQEVTANDKIGGLRAMGAWALPPSGRCETPYPVAKRTKRTPRQDNG